VEALGLSEPLLVGIAVYSLAGLAFYVTFAAGQFNVSQAGFMAIGAYAVAISTTNGFGIALGAVTGIILSGVLGWLLSAITMRISGVYLSIATLAFVQIVQQSIYITPALNGALGIYGIPLALNAVECWIILIVVSSLMYRMMRSRFGYAMRIVREDPVVANGIGVDQGQVRLVTGCLSGVIASIAGSMQALTTSYISPDEFGFGLLVQIMSFGIVGGTDRLWGPILGAAVLITLPEYTRTFADYRMVFTGIIIVGVVVSFPEGLVGPVLRLVQRLKPFLGSLARKNAEAADGVAGLTLSLDRRAPQSDDDFCSAIQVSKRFGGVHAVESCDLALTTNRVYGLIGPNGAGKSTLVDLISGQSRSDSGKLLLGGVDVTTLPGYRRAQLGIARTFQHSRVTQNITAHEVVYSGYLMKAQPSSWARILGLPKANQIHRDAAKCADEILAYLSLASVRNRYVRDLGWEEQRRLEIARAIALKPSVLLLDEPTAGMHADSLNGLGDIIRKLAGSGMAVLLIEHNVSFMRTTADVLYAMDSGKIIASGQVEEVLDSKQVIDSYLGENVS
jgi:branched-chain amino acid transport system permease protein